jgi:phage gpG-like protein
MNITIKVDSKQVKNILANLEIGLRNPDEPLNKTKKWLTNDIQQNFTSEGKRYGMWQPLADSTQRERAFKGFGPQHPILVRSGDLKGGFRTIQQRDKLEVENKIKYFQYHQSSGARKPGGLPRRIMMDIDNVSINAIANYFVAWIVKLIKGGI